MHAFSHDGTASLEMVEEKWELLFESISSKRAVPFEKIESVREKN